MYVNLKKCYVLLRRVEVAKPPESDTSKQDLPKENKQQKQEREQTPAPAVQQTGGGSPSSTRGNMQEQVACIFCPTKFGKEPTPDLIEHMTSHAEEKTYSYCKLPPSPFHDTSDEPVTIYRCLICFKEYYSKVKLLTHLRLSHQSEATNEEKDWKTRFVGILEEPSEEAKDRVTDKIVTRRSQGQNKRIEQESSRAGSQDRTMPVLVEVEVAARKFECFVCKELFASKEQITSHLLSQHKNH